MIKSSKLAVAGLELLYNMMPRIGIIIKSSTHVYGLRCDWVTIL